jgi:hypothetical protein
MKLEQTLEIYSTRQTQGRVSERQRVYTLVDLESLSVSALYTGDNAFTSSSKVFIPSSSRPLIRYDPADAHHPKGHIHLGNSEAVEGLSSEEAAAIYAKVWAREKSQET